MNKLETKSSLEATTSTENSISSLQSDTKTYEEISNLRNLFENLADLLFEKEEVLRSNEKFLIRVSNKKTESSARDYDYKISKISVRQGRLWDFICRTPNFVDVHHETIIMIVYEGTFSRPNDTSSRSQSDTLWSESPKVGDWVLVQARTFSSSIERLHPQEASLSLSERDDFRRPKRVSVFTRFVDSLDL